MSLKAGQHYKNAKQAEKAMYNAAQLQWGFPQMRFPQMGFPKPRFPRKNQMNQMMRPNHPGRPKKSSREETW